MGKMRSDSRGGRTDIKNGLMVAETLCCASDPPHFYDGPPSGGAEGNAEANDCGDPNVACLRFGTNFSWLERMDNGCRLLYCGERATCRSSIRRFLEPKMA